MRVATQGIAAVDERGRWLPPGKGTPPALNPREGRPAKSQNPKRVLIVEDDLDSARSMYLLVQDMGHTAEYVINGYVAVDYVRRFRPDVILLDLGLPDLDGFEVCSRIKQDPELRHIRVIVITGYAQERHRARSKAVGCELHLLKPVPARVIEQILD
jgi:CheY-like chemotaxis protein